MYEVCIRGAVRCLDLDVRPGQIRGVREWRQHHRESRAYRQRAKVPSGNVGPALRKLVQIIVVTHTLASSGSNGVSEFQPIARAHMLHPPPRESQAAAWR